MSGLQVHGIGRRRLVYKEVVEVWQNYKISYFWWFGNSACGDSVGSSQTENNKVAYLLHLFGGMGKKGHSDLACGVLEEDLVNAGLWWCLILLSVILILWRAGLALTHGCCITSGKWNVSCMTLQEFSIRKIILIGTHTNLVPVT